MTPPLSPTNPRPEIMIRSANVKDIGALRLLFDASIDDGQVPSNDTGADIDNLMEGYFEDEGASGFWVAHRDDCVMGMVGVQRVAQGQAEVRRLRVHEDYRRQGVGGALMGEALAFCQERGYLKVILDVRIERTGAISLFEKFGFHLSRSRECDGRKLLDFYVDLYSDTRF